MDFLHSRQHFNVARIEVGRNSDATEHSLARSGGTVNFKAELDQLIDDMLNLVFTGGILHCDNHELAR